MPDKNSIGQIVKAFLLRYEKEVASTISLLNKKLDEFMATCKDMMSAMDKKIDNIPTIKGDKGDMGYKGEKGDKGNPGKDGKNGVDGKDGINGKDGTSGVDGTNGDIKDLSPEEIRDELELLQGNDRLDKAAIKGLDEEIKRLESLPRGGTVGGAKGIQVQVAGVKTMLNSQTVNFIAGSNVTITSSIVSGVTTLSFSASGSSANQSDNETPTGTIDGVNTVFTLAHTPSPAARLKVYLNGAFQTAGGEDYTLSGSTITFINPPLTASVLRVFYDY